MVFVVVFDINKIDLVFFILKQCKHTHVYTHANALFNLGASSFLFLHFNPFCIVFFFTFEHMHITRGLFFQNSTSRYIRTYRHYLSMLLIDTAYRYYLSILLINSIYRYYLSFNSLRGLNTKNAYIHSYFAW